MPLLVGGRQMMPDLWPLKVCLYVFDVKLSTSALKTAKLNQIDARGAQCRAVIKTFCNYRPATATSGQE